MDIRSQKTKQSISDCFLRLLQEKPVTRITVTEICKLVKINRATFYNYYQDVPDLHEKLEQEILTDFENFLRGRVFSDNARYKETLVEALCYMKRVGERFYTLCSINAASDLPARSFQVINSLAFPIMKERMPAAEEQNAKLLYQYITHGSGAILVGWLQGDTGKSAEEMAELIMRISGSVVQTEIFSGTGA